MLFRWLLLSALCLSCAPSLGEPYVRSQASAKRAYSHGRYEAAARAWAKAAKQAPNRKRREQARHREAQSWQRASRIQNAYLALVSLEQKSRDSPIHARVSYDLALVELSHVSEAKARSRLEKILHQHPDSPIARSTLRRLMQMIRRDGGEAACQEFRDGALKAQPNSPLAEDLHYRSARYWDQEKKLAVARDRYAYVAEHYPYPTGVYWNEAMVRGARLDVKLDEPRKAEKRLLEMLSRRER